MKTAIIYGPRDLRVEEVDRPDIGADDVLVRVRASGICGSDVHRYLGTDYGRTCSPYPMNSGHEYCGEVVEVGSQVQTFGEGDRVTLGVAWASGDLGAFSDYLHVRDADRRLHKLPGEMDFIDGALIETFIVALKSYRRPSPTPDDSILILGAGPIGLAVLLYCRAMGLGDITMSEPSVVRRDLAARIGAVTVNPAVEDLAEVVASSGKEVDVVFECAGQEETLKQAMRLTRPEGRISLIGHYSKTPHFNIEDLVMKGLNVFAPIGGNPFFDEAVELVAEKKVDLAQLVSHQYPIEKAQEAFDMASDVDRSVKVIFSD
ncbi:MAG: zinc-binding dehydrogenase [Gemmatimonadetes bacterium]|nr:zinc-binding dehydrogenase [Gemmatimonadota bacterium]